MSAGQADGHLDAGDHNADAEITEKLDDESDLDGKKFSSEREVQKLSEAEENLEHGKDTVVESPILCGGSIKFLLLSCP